MASMDREGFIFATACVIVVIVATIAVICAAPPSLAATRALPLRYNKTLMGLGFPSPLLRASVRGHSAWFIVDTGASVHTLASWLVSAAHLEPRDTKATATGSTGVKMPVRAVADQTIHVIGGGNLTLREAIVVEFPPIFAEHEIGGLMSPQLLSSEHGAAVLDLRVPTLRFEPFDTAVAGLARNRQLISNDSRVCRNAESLFENRLYAAAVAADGSAGMMLIDTGATSTVAVPHSSIADALTAHDSENVRTQGVGGDAQTTRKVPHVRFTRGGADSTISITLGGSVASCGGDGLIGMDALRRCVLVLGESAFAWSCEQDEE